MPLVRLDNLQQFAAVDLRLDQGAVGGPVIVPSAAQIGLVWTQEDGRTAHNVLYGRYAGTFAGSVAQANGILTGLTTGAAWTTLAGSLASTGGLAAVTIRNVAIEDQPLIQSSGGGALGTSSGSTLPNEVAACVTLRTAETGPGNRGRFYIPGFATTALGSGNVIAAATVVAINNWVATFAGVFSANGYTWVLGLKKRAAYTSSVTGTAHPARDATTKDLVTMACRDNHWDNQRRRGLK
jgi:hypothetical protein